MSDVKTRPAASAGTKKLMPFFNLDGDRYVPTEASLGYWGPGTLNGRVIGAILGFALDREFGNEDWVPARFCVDLLRLSPAVPLHVVHRVVRAGGRLKLIDSELYAGDLLVARSNCQYLKRTANPPVPTWSAPTWDAPPPHGLELDGRSRHWEVRPIKPEQRTAPRAAGAPLPPGVSSANPPVLGVLSPFEARQAWTRDTREIVDGFAHTPFTRVAAAADFASPLANSSLLSIDYVNSDFTVYLHRLPRTEWLGFDMVQHLAEDGVALGECWLYDEDGAIGTVNTAAIAQRQR
jgi:hypothetical protein